MKLLIRGNEKEEEEFQAEDVLKESYGCYVVVQKTVRPGNRKKKLYDRAAASEEPVKKLSLEQV